LAEAKNPPCTGDRDKCDLTSLAGLEAHRRAGRNIEPAATCLATIKGEPRVCLIEMIVRTDLHRTIAAIGNLQHHDISTLVELDIAGSSDDFTRYHPHHRPTVSA